MMKIYLGGPITGLTKAEAQEWRTRAADLLTDVGFSVLNPLRGTPINKRGRIGGPADRELEKPYSMRSDKAIVHRDLFLDIATSDVVLFNFAGAAVASIGSCVEVGYCLALRKFAVVVVAQHSVHDHAFIREVGPSFLTVEDAVDFLAVSVPEAAKPPQGGGGY